MQQRAVEYDANGNPVVTPVASHAQASPQAMPAATPQAVEYDANGDPVVPRKVNAGLDFIKGAWDQQPVHPEDLAVGAANDFADPMTGVTGALKSIAGMPGRIASSHGATFQRMIDSAKGGDYRTAGMHLINSIIPIVGPINDENQMAAARGDISVPELMGRTAVIGTEAALGARGPSASKPPRSMNMVTENVPAESVGPGGRPFHYTRKESRLEPVVETPPAAAPARESSQGARSMVGVVSPRAYHAMRALESAKPYMKPIASHAVNAVKGASAAVPVLSQADLLRQLLQSTIGGGQ